MPSEPDSGPTTISRPSCSTSFRAARTAESGDASVDWITSSMTLPAALPPKAASAVFAPRTPSSPSTVYVPSSVAITESGVSLPVAGFSSVGTPAIVNSKLVASLSNLTVWVFLVTAGSAQISYDVSSGPGPAKLSATATLTFAGNFCAASRTDPL